MSELQIFKNDEFGEVRTTIIDGKPYFCGSDIAKALGYAKPYDAITQHCEKDDTVSCSITDSLGRTQEAKFITEGNVHRLIVAAAKQSKNKNIQEKAKQYASWIFDEIVPSVRANGYYAMPEVEVTHDIPDTPIGDVATWGRLIRSSMKDMGRSPKKIAEAIKLLADQWGIAIPDDFCEVENEQYRLF